jgi:sirohydrochlorin cobaltochelatase
MNPSGAGPQAIVLFGHGSRDPRWAQTLNEVAERMRAQAPEVQVHCAYLEFMQPDLPSVLHSLAAQGLERIRIAPMFLAAGGHVLRDLPALAQAAVSATPQVRLEILPALGTQPEVMDALAATACR